MDAWEPWESHTPAPQITMSKNKITYHYMYIMRNDIGLRYIRPFVTKCSFISVKVHADPWKLWWKSYNAYFLGWQNRPVCSKHYDRSMWNSAPITSTYQALWFFKYHAVKVIKLFLFQGLYYWYQFLRMFSDFVGFESVPSLLHKMFVQ